MAECPALSSGMNDRNDLLQELLSLHQLMLQWAEEGNWVSVAAAEKLRQEHLNSFFREAIPGDRVQETRSALKNMLDINDSIMSLVKKSRGGVGQDISSIQKGRRALAAYGENTNPVQTP
jgi:hypothetical protein